MTPRGALARQIDLIVVGKLKEAAWQDIQSFYLQRLERYTHLRLVEVKDRIGKGGEEAQALKQEGEQLLQALPPGGHCLLLTPGGDRFGSIEFAEHLNALSVREARLCFIVGGPTGVSDAVLQRADSRLSLSSMTFPHELARIVLLEQLYRAASILRGEAYHK